MLELRRGLGLILGEIGVGKTTLLRTLYQLLADSQEYCPHIILDPSAKSEYTFLKKVAQSLGVDPGFRSTENYRNAIEHFLFNKALEQRVAVVLFIDEAQRLTEPGFEVLRTLLNYETHDEKLIQLVLFGQMELLSTIRRVEYFWDRIALRYIVKPLQEDEIRELIDFRLKAAGHSGNGGVVFEDDAVRAIYAHTHGYPRKVMMICHDALEYLVMNDRTVVNREIVADLVQQDAEISRLTGTLG